MLEIKFWSGLPTGFDEDKLKQAIEKHIPDGTISPSERGNVSPRNPLMGQ